MNWFLILKKIKKILDKTVYLKRGKNILLFGQEYRENNLDTMWQCIHELMPTNFFDQCVQYGSVLYHNMLKNKVK